MNSNSFVHEHNSRLLALIELLEPTYALAIIVLYRALLNSVLAKEIPKYYNRAAKYVQQLETWNKQINDWKTIPPHEAYWKLICQQHGKKSAFWKRLNP